jgi:hypothetical protein
MSDFHRLNTQIGISKSFVDYEVSQLPQYSIEELSEKIQKGEVKFFTKNSLTELDSKLSKGEIDSSDELSKSIKALTPIVVNKTDLDYEVGYILKVETTQD